MTTSTPIPTASEVDAICKARRDENLKRREVLWAAGAAKRKESKAKLAAKLSDPTFAPFLDGYVEEVMALRAKIKEEAAKRVEFNRVYALDHRTTKFRDLRKALGEKYGTTARIASRWYIAELHAKLNALRCR